LVHSPCWFNHEALKWLPSGVYRFHMQIPLIAASGIISLTKQCD
jgi:hypothetical protein